MRCVGPLALVLALAFWRPVAAQETEIHYLSGRGVGSEVSWGFNLVEGRGAGGWTFIKVPAHWEQQGFGAYNYGHDEDKTSDIGFYRLSFPVPEAWQGRHVELVFEGVMTDSYPWVNGTALAPHKGGFTRFSYDISALLRYGDSNQLEIEVYEISTDDSIELAERDADYWVFGGIYRPVYLAVSPAERLAHWPIDARADGSLRIPVELAGLTAAAELELSVETLDGRLMGSPLRQRVEGGTEKVELTGTFSGVSPWNAEQPTLYRARLVLRRGEEVLHSASKRFGFRSFERRVDGFYVNGRRILLKGVNRHVFYPDSGRTSNSERDRRDVELIKSLHMNAVRTAHYPPDVAFLDACDELGLYVIDELPGWHDAYDTEPARQLVAEMVRRDADHPSILFWANGNEGGHNFDVDADFARHDPQGRLVLHPQKVFSGFDTFHYPTWNELIERLDPGSLRSRWRDLWGEPLLFLPTEFQHGLYDGGGGASLADFWQAIRSSPLGVGGFLWTFTDEAIARSDRDGALDSAGNYGPDGILGPWREPSGSSIAVAEIFAPVQVLVPAAPFPGDSGGELVPHLENWDGRVLLENRFDFLDLGGASLAWRTLRYPELPGPAQELASGRLPLPVTPPGRQVTVLLDQVPWRQAEVLELLILLPDGREAGRRTAWVQRARNVAWAALPTPPAVPRIVNSADKAVLEDTAARVELDAKTGALLALRDGKARLPLAAPLATSRVLAGAELPTPEAVRFFKRLEPRAAVGVDLRYEEPAAAFSWLLLGQGWVRFSYWLEAPASPLPGIFFPLEPERVLAFSWLGPGPARVWRNRLAGQIGWHHKVPSQLVNAGTELGHEPIFAGYYGPLRRAVFELTEGQLELLFEENTYLGVGVPSFPDDAKKARAQVLPREGISFLHELTAIGNKFDEPAKLGPAASAEEREKLHAGVVWLRFTAHPEPKP